MLDDTMVVELGVHKDRHKYNDCTNEQFTRGVITNFRKILVNDQLDTQFPFLYVYFNSLNVSSNLVLIRRRINCINTTSGMCQSV
jgi:hypothetical protein